VVFGVLAACCAGVPASLRYARNITDVDDKINAAAREAGVPIDAITGRFAKAYREDMAALGVRRRRHRAARNRSTSRRSSRCANS
jgi:cysteinyl-tRNA synthetase